MTTAADFLEKKLADYGKEMPPFEALASWMDEYAHRESVVSPDREDVLKIIDEMIRTEETNILNGIDVRFYLGGKDRLLILRSRLTPDRKAGCLSGRLYHEMNLITGTCFHCGKGLQQILEEKII